MDRSKLIWLGVFVGGAVGSYIPALWGSSLLSISSILLSGLGSIVGIWVAFKISD
jgi:hypothetical protein